MKYQDALDETMKAFKITAVEISRLSGVGENHISRFRHGQNVTIETMEKVICSLPPAARSYFYGLLLVDSSLNSQKNQCPHH